MSPRFTVSGYSVPAWPSTLWGGPASRLGVKINPLCLVAGKRGVMGGGEGMGRGRARSPTSESCRQSVSKTPLTMVGLSHSAYSTRTRHVMQQDLPTRTIMTPRLHLDVARDNALILGWPSTAHTSQRSVFVESATDRRGGCAVYTVRRGGCVRRIHTTFTSVLSWREVGFAPDAEGSDVVDGAASGWYHFVAQHCPTCVLFFTARGQVTCSPWVEKKRALEADTVASIMRCEREKTKNMKQYRKTSVCVSIKVRGIVIPVQVDEDPYLIR